MPEMKVWGVTECLFEGETTSIHWLQFNEGGYTSRHLHRFRHNLFYVQNGRIRVEWYEEGMVHSKILGPGDCTVVPIGVIHRFVALTSGSMYEVYIAQPGHRIMSDDIHRLDKGGRDTPQWLKAAIAKQEERDAALDDIVEANRRHRAEREERDAINEELSRLHMDIEGLKGSPVFAIGGPDLGAKVSELESRVAAVRSQIQELEESRRR